ncbi:MAG: NAD(P)-dependent oxidoreductase [Qipengyuania sp.]
MADAKRRLIARAGGLAVSEAEAHGARIGFVALEDDSEARKAALRLKRAGLLVNVADRPDLCDFTLPSVLDRDPVLVAVSTGGASAALAKHLRLRFEAILPQTLGKLAKALFAAQGDLQTRFPDPDDRRRALDLALQEGGALDPFRERSAECVDVDRLASEVDGATATIEIALTSDDPDDLTLRQARLLGRADRVIHEPGIAGAILHRARADAMRKVIGEATNNPGEGLTVVLRRAQL